MPKKEKEELELTLDYEKIEKFFKSGYLPYLLLVGIFFIALTIRLPPAKHETLLAMDPFYHYQYAKLVLEGVSPGERIKRVSPPGAIVRYRLYSYLEAYSFKITKLFFSNLDLLTFSKYFPAIMGALIVIPIFFLTKKLTKSNVAALFSAFFLGTSPFYLQKTMAGFNDTDVISLLLPLTAFAFYFYALNTKKKYKSAAYSTFSFIFLGFAGWAWGGSWYAFYYLLGFAGLFLIYQLIFTKNKFEGLLKSKKVISLTFIVLLAASLLAAYLSTFGGYSAKLFFKWPLIPFKFQPKREVGEAFPNVYVSVSEMQTTSLKNIFNRLGLVGVLSIMGLGYLVYERYKGKDKLQLTLLLGVMLLSGIYASLVAVRFIKFLLLPCTILSGFFFVPVFDWIKKEDDQKKLYGKLFLAMLLVVPILWLPTNQSYQISSNIGSSMTKNWLNAFDWIKEENNTDPCSIMITYWDPGHAIYALGERANAFDGASQNTKRTITVRGNLTDEEAHDVVLVNEYATEKFENNGKVYTNITTARIQDIATTLYTGNETKALKILKRYEPNCGEVYYLATSDLIGKSYWWSYFSTWTDERGTGNPSNYMMAGRAQRRIIDGKMTYVYAAGNNAFLVQKVNNTFIPYIWTNEGGKVINKIYYFEQGQQQSREFDGMEGTIWVSPNFDYIVYMPPRLKNSMFSKLFFFNGQGLENFELVKNFGGEVKLFKVNLTGLEIA